MKDLEFSGLRAEILRRVIALPRSNGDSDPGANTNEVSLKSVLIPANTFRIQEVYSFDAYGLFLGLTGTGTLRLKFGGTTLFSVSITGNPSSWYWRGFINRLSDSTTLQFGAVTFNPDGTTFVNQRGEASVSQNFAINNIFEITGQKTASGDTLAVEAFLVYKHPLI